MSICYIALFKFNYYFEDSFEISSFVPRGSGSGSMFVQSLRGDSFKIFVPQGSGSGSMFVQSLRGDPLQECTISRLTRLSLTCICSTMFLPPVEHTHRLCTCSSTLEAIHTKLVAQAHTQNSTLIHAHQVEGLARASAATKLVTQVTAQRHHHQYAAQTYTFKPATVEP
ncbi:hypothetical protein CMV_015922 [Castanea mollissima]|uniref:Uncharacterized protein n=1 Tax=Castanea mollissima TaxID=60419 RepID=A0A8J4VJF8_9ROSI|nr:hypothetical protein CMV_015922 [Castanea mollissima]